MEAGFQPVNRGQVRRVRACVRGQTVMAGQGQSGSFGRLPHRHDKEVGRGWSTSAHRPRRSSRGIPPFEFVPPISCLCAVGGLGVTSPTGKKSHGGHDLECMRGGRVARGHQHFYLHPGPFGSGAMCLGRTKGSWWGCQRRLASLDFFCVANDSAPMHVARRSPMTEAA